MDSDVCRGIVKHTALLVLCVLTVACSERVNESDFETHLKKGNTYADQSAWDKAIGEYQQAIKIDPNQAKVHYNLGLAYFYSYMDLRSNNAKKETFKLLLNRRSQKEGEVIDGEDEHTRELNANAIREWKRAIELDDSISGAHYFLGTHYHNIGNLKEAEKELKRAIELNPGYSNSYSVLASVYEKMNKLELSVVYHKETLKIEPYSESNHYDLLGIYLKLGQMNEAKREYDYLKSRESIFLNGFDDLLLENRK